MKNKNIILLVLIVVTMTCMFKNNVLASNDKNSEQLGFEISEKDYSQFGYITEKYYNNYYNGNVVGKTTYNYIYCRGKNKALGKYSDLCCIKILTEPNSIVMQETFMFVKYNKTYKFGISSLEVISDKSKYSNFTVNRINYLTTADKATQEMTSAFNATISVCGAGISYSNVETITKSIVDISDKSTRTKINLKFIFGSPTTLEQKERVYEQTCFYIFQQYLNSTSTYKNETIFKSVYKCGNKSSTMTYTVTTPIGY